MKSGLILYKWQKQQFLVILSQNQGYTLQLKSKESKRQEMEYVAHITLLSSISKYWCFFSSLIVKRKPDFFYFLPSNKSNVENLIKLTTLFKAHIALLVI